MKLHCECMWCKIEGQAGSMLEIGADVFRVRGLPANSRHKIPILKIDIKALILNECL